MPTENRVPTDTRDMFSVHEAFRRGLGDARGQLAAISDGDTERARHFAAYLDELLWLLYIHHAGEDELLYPLLAERVPEQHGLFSRMEGQHVAATAGLEASRRAAKDFGESGSVADGRVLADACDALLAALVGHLEEEELEVVPLASRFISPPEWGALPQHAFSAYAGTRIWLPFGLAVEAMPDDLMQGLLTHAPPIAGMWTGGGSDAFAAEMAAIRGGV